MEVLRAAILPRPQAGMKGGSGWKIVVDLCLICSQPLERLQPEAFKSWGLV